MIKLIDFIINESISPVKIDNVDDLKMIDKLIQYSYNMGENSKILWRGIRVEQNYPIYNILQDRDWFRGANLGARTIMKKLGIKNPAFGYIGNMQTVTKIFGKTFIIILKQPYDLFQSNIVSDVMSWAQPVIYKETNKYGGFHRQSVGMRSEEEQIKKALDGAKTYKKLNELETFDDNRNEVIIDTKEYWAIDIARLHSDAGKFVRQYQNEKEPVSFSRITRLEDYIENYGEVIEILSKYKNFISWKFKNPK